MARSTPKTDADTTPEVAPSKKAPKTEAKSPRKTAAPAKAETPPKTVAKKKEKVDAAAVSAPPTPSRAPKAAPQAAPEAKAAPKRSKKVPTKADSPAESGRGSAPSAEELQGRIAERAYLIAEARGFAPGNEMEDWLRAEREILGALQAG